MDAQGLYDPRYEHDSCGVGFVCKIDGEKSFDIVQKGLTVLDRLAHRGAVGADPKTGDGAGILIQTPHDFFKEVVSFKLPEAGGYGTGLVFFPTKKDEREKCRKFFEDAVKAEGQVLLGWRDVPVDNSVIGESAQSTEPVIEQIFIGKSKDVADPLAFEKKLYLIRRAVERQVKKTELSQQSFFYVVSLSARTFTYKGLLMPEQVRTFFRDLSDPRVKSAIAFIHSRYSTNTFPTWDLAQPFRFVAHNGEINTLRGNINWMTARGYDVIVPGGSDSAMLDNVFEMLVLEGRSLAHAMMMLIPVAWEQNHLMPKEQREFYRYHACLTEAWDGPAAMAFTDGTRIGAILDRNGLRPARYVVTTDGLVVMASEVGVLDIDPAKIQKSGRLEPGRIFYIDTQEKRIIDDEEIKHSMAVQKPYGTWLKENLVELKNLPKPKNIPAPSKDLMESLNAFGYTREDINIIVAPMAETAKEPVGSMGNDIPPAVLSKQPQLPYSYFKQLFAQVTNPPIDSIREELVMSLESFIGPQKDILKETPEHAHRLHVLDPILLNEETAKIKEITERGFKAKTISILFKEGDFEKRLDAICKEAEGAIRSGYSFIVLSDRGVNREWIPIPALMAVGAVHHHLTQKSLRTQVGIVIETGEPREVHHFALLFGYGADAIDPYLAYELVEDLCRRGEIKVDAAKAIDNFRHAIAHGVLKILSKMGISTLASYRGAQIFEALGLAPDVIDKCFVGTPSRIGGADLAALGREAVSRHRQVFNLERGGVHVLRAGGIYQWRRDEEFHMWNPDTIFRLQSSARTGDYNQYKEFAALVNDQGQNPTTPRALFKFANAKPIPLDQVEPISAITKRFCTGAMSFGSISRAAHEGLAVAMNRLGGRSNTGEGGEDPTRFIPRPNGDSARSAIKQVASGRFGVTTNYLVNADELQIKIAQGAKPGEGGQLPGHKVSAIIAKTRFTTPGVTLISPPPHHDIYSIEDLAQLIYDLKNVNPRAIVSVKLVSEVGVGTVAAGVAKGHADLILISGGDGGTGASPISSIKHAGIPWELGISETHQTLVLNDLRSRVRLQTDGQMRTGRDVAIAAILGAEEYGFSTGPLIVFGCILLRNCHLNTCSVGIATQDPRLEAKFAGEVDHVVNYFQFVAQELREIMAQLGIRTVNELIGRTDLLEVDRTNLPEKAAGLDLSKIFHRPKSKSPVYQVQQQDHNIAKILDRKLIEIAKPALENGTEVNAELEIKNVNRTTGAMLSGEVCKKYGEEGLPPDTINIKFRGVAGQSFGAWLAKGVTFELEGMANDYVGKGLSGGKLIIYPNSKVPYAAEDNSVIGNTTFYGAIMGEAYIRGRAGERFCIRNSGLRVVIEGVGDHGCEYMTGGCVVVLGPVGRNFAAGMSGGVAYVYDPEAKMKQLCNFDMVEIDPMLDSDRQTLHAMITQHVQYTGSAMGKKILANFAAHADKFVKIMPMEYKKILEIMDMEAKLNLEEVSDG